MTRFFGYGSLVNRKTHAYRNTQPAIVTGWRRHWVPSNRRDVAFLSVEPAADSQIMGLLADVQPLGWPALDLRETGYRRAKLTAAEIDQRGAESIQMYSADPDFIAPRGPEKHALLSYIDCVIQGFMAEFGEAGVANFFATTTGWEVKIRDDRSAPIYPRAVQASPEETRLVDRYLAQLAVEIV